MKKVLHLTLMKEYFDAILSGDKKIEFREYKLYWKNRLENKKYDYIHFVNGYGKDKPWMDVEIKEVKLNTKDLVYWIYLGKVLRKGNIS